MKKIELITMIFLVVGLLIWIGILIKDNRKLNFEIYTNNRLVEKQREVLGLQDSLINIQEENLGMQDEIISILSN